MGMGPSLQAHESFGVMTIHDFTSVTGLLNRCWRYSTDVREKFRPLESNMCKARFYAIRLRLIS